MLDRERAKRGEEAFLTLILGDHLTWGRADRGQTHGQYIDLADVLGSSADVLSEALLGDSEHEGR